MARDGKKMMHIHSNVPNKQPKADILEYGELAINNAAGNEFISTKNSDDEVVRFSSDGKMVSIIEKKEIIPYEGKVIDLTEDDLLNNQSQILIKLNQVAAKDTNGYDTVNGAVDMHGDEINPSDDGGKTNGAGFAIDMSRYAMIGANPSFSSITSSELLADDELFIGANKELEEGVEMPEIAIYGDSVRVHAENGSVGVTAAEDINISGMGDGNFNVENDLCVGSGNETKISGLKKTVVGTDCADNRTENLVLNGDSVVISGDTVKIIGLTDDSYENNYVNDGRVEADGTIVLERKGLDNDVQIYGLADFIHSATDDNYVISGRVEDDGTIMLDRTGTLTDAPVTGLAEYVSAQTNGLFASVEYTTSGEAETKVIVFKDKTGTVVGVVDATNFIKDGMVNEVKIADVESGASTVKCLVVTFNTDAGKDDIKIPLSDIFDADQLNNYYTKEEINAVLGDAFIASAVVSSVTEVILANELTVAAALNDLNDRVIEVSGDVIDIKVDVEELKNRKDNFVTDGEVNSGTGIIHLNMSESDEPAVVTGLEAYITSKIGSVSADTFVDGGNVDSGTGIINLVKNDGTDVPPITGLAEFVESKVAGLSGDTFVDSGSVNSGTGIINLVKNDGTLVQPISGLAEYVESKLGSVSADTFVTGGSVNSGTGVINLVKNDGTPVDPITGLSQYVSGKTDGLFKEVTYVESSHTYVFKDSDGDEVGSIPAIATVSEVTTDASGNTWIKFKDENGNEISELTINANEFVKDGMVSNVEIKDVESGASMVNCLVITFNTDAGKDNINIPISEIFDPGWLNNYYTKQEINNALGEWFYPSAITSSVTDVISGMQLTIAAALNDLNDRVIDVSGDVIDLGDRVTVVENNSITGGSVSGTILYLDKQGGGSIPISGLPIPGSTEYDGVVTGGTVGANGTIILKRKKGDGTDMTDATVTGLADYVHDDYVISGSVGNNGVITLNRLSGGTAPVTGLSSYITGHYLPLSGGTVSGNTTFTSDLVASGSNGITATKFVKNGGTDTQVLMADGSVKELGAITGDNNDYVESGFVASDGDITLNMHSGGTAHVTGLSDYVSSVTQNFITAAQDKYVSAGTVGNDGVITLNLRHGGTAQVTGLETYINDKLDGNDYVVSGFVASNGDITLNMHSGGTAPVTGLAEYVANHSSSGDWVDVSGDTMTGKLRMSGAPISFTDGEDELTISSSNPENLSISSTSADVHVTIDGDVTATGAMYSSDKRLKENIELVSAEDIENVKNIGFKSFNFISNKESKKIGVIAQELQDNGLGKLTATNEAGYLTVDYISLLCLKIAELEKEIKELKNGK